MEKAIHLISSVFGVDSSVLCSAEFIYSTPLHKSTVATRNLTNNCVAPEKSRVWRIEGSAGKRKGAAKLTRKRERGKGESSFEVRTRLFRTAGSLYRKTETSGWICRMRMYVSRTLYY